MPRAKKLDIARLSKPRLLALQAEIQKALAADREKERIALRKRLEAMAAAAGFRLESLQLANKTSPGRRARRGPAPIKYRDPENPSNVWSGRGMRARWLADKVKRGARIEQYLVS